MSLCRFGSPCTATFPWTYQVDVDCKDCPGSDVYIFETREGEYDCSGCSLRPGLIKSQDELFAHILQHEAAGHHVRRSLVEFAKGNTPALEAESKAVSDAIDKARAEGATGEDIVAALVGSHWKRDSGYPSMATNVVGVSKVPPKPPARWWRPRGPSPAGFFAAAQVKKGRPR